ncbi:helix-turn-helix domain-containing protein [Pimelobacter simplex]|uniref:helix-turn-helix domain-containing protein n=1 Tax=Nocardioides simplex TaxID=2045 RepID=UPI003AB02F49
MTAPAAGEPEVIDSLGHYTLWWRGLIGPAAADRTVLIATNWIRTPRLPVSWGEHVHPDHEMLWGSDGKVGVQVAGREYWVPASYGLWIPAGVPHSACAVSGTGFNCTWVDRERSPVRATEPVLLPMSPLLVDLLDHLRIDTTTPERRRRAEEFALDLLEPDARGPLSVPRPTSAAARRVADAVLAELTVPRTAEEWAGEFGMSARSLNRAFVAETGLAFGQWRVRARMAMAATLLDQGRTVASVARQVGYRNSSAFIAAYRRTTGASPAQHRQHMTHVT